MGGRGAYESAGRMAPNDPVAPGRGRGSGAPASWRHNAIPLLKDTEDDNLQDTATSAVKNLDVVMTKDDTSDPGAKRRLNMSSEIGDEEERDKNGAGNGALAAMVIDENLLPKKSLTWVVNEERKKRSKKEGANSTSLGSAGSREEPVRSQ
jgi:hypothetical protein